MTKYNLMLPRFSVHIRYLKLRVVVHPAHGGRCQGGFLWTVHCVQRLQDPVYCMKMALLPVSDREAGRRSQLCYLGVKQNNLTDNSLKQLAGLSPVSVCCSPAVTKEPSCRLGTIFVFIMVLSCQEAACRVSKVWNRNLFRVDFLYLHVY